MTIISKEAKILTIKEGVKIMTNCPHFNKNFICPDLNYHNNSGVNNGILAMKISHCDKISELLYLVQKGKSSKAAFLLIENDGFEIKSEFLNEKSFKKLFDVDF